MSLVLYLEQEQELFNQQNCSQFKKGKVINNKATIVTRQHWPS